MRNLLMSLTIVFLFNQACEKKIEDANLPEHEPGFAVEAFLQGDQPARVFVDRSEPIQDKLDSLDPEQVEVKLYEEGEKVTNLNYLQNGFFGAKYKIQPDKRYRVEVSGPNLPTAKGNTRIPTEVTIDSLSFEDSADQAPNTDVLHALNITFEDPADTRDYYGIEAILPDSAGQSRLNLVSFDPVINFEYKGVSYLDDANFNGQKQKLTLLVDGEEYTPSELKGKLILRLRHIAKPFYKYSQSLEEQAGTGGTGPFSGEPALTEGNVKNGYGCVGGVYADVRRVK